MIHLHMHYDHVLHRNKNTGHFSTAKHYPLSPFSGGQNHPNTGIQIVQDASFIHAQKK